MTAHPSREDLAAYALGGLDHDEARTVLAHAEACERCRAELRYLAPAVGVLAESVDPVEPPAALRERLLAIVREEAAEADPEPAGRGARRPRFRFGSILLRPAAGLAAVALLVAGLGGYLAGADGEKTRTVQATEAAEGADGELVLSDEDATLRLSGIAQLERGAVYQVWVADASGAVRPSATFLPHADGTATAAVPEAREDATRVMVTAEPGPNRADPTLPPIITVGTS